MKNTLYEIACFLFPLTNVDGVLYFNLQDSTSGTELWKSNGTAAGTSMVKDIWPGLGDVPPDKVGRLFYYYLTRN
jgi:ELWxxDGT repeat protein